MPASSRATAGPAPEALYKNGFTVNGANGQQVASMFDPSAKNPDGTSEHRFLSGLVDVVVAELQNPYNNGGLSLSVGYSSCSDRMAA
jgi:hypothetical protein